VTPEERATLVAHLREQARLCAAGGADATAALMTRGAEALQEAQSLLALDAVLGLGEHHGHPTTCPACASPLAHSEPPPPPPESPLAAAIRRAVDALASYAAARDLAIESASRGLSAMPAAKLAMCRVEELDSAIEALALRLGTETAEGRPWWERSVLAARGIVDVAAWTEDLHALAQAEAEEAMSDEDERDEEAAEQAARDQDAEYRAAIDPRRMW